MKTAGIQPAQIDFDTAPEPGAAASAPRSPRYGDIYHPHVGPAEQARHVFLQGNGLPGRWGGRERFVIVETGFGLGNNFLATWQAWRDDPARCQRLVFVSVELHPPTAADLARAHAATPWPELAAALQAQWPPLTPNVHGLEFEGGRVQLLLALGDAAALLPALRASADAFYLDGFAPARNPQIWQPRVIKALARLAAPGATAATWSVARALQENLASAGFEVQLAPGTGGKREITTARFAPRHEARPPPALHVPAREAVVLGAGLAGAAVAQALARQGLTVTVLERHAEPAQESSGNPGGLFHGTLNADDGPYARLYRTAALAAQREFGAAIAAGVPGQAQGLLRLDTGSTAAAQALLQRTGLPPGYVQWFDAAAAQAAAGVVLPAPAWFYPGGGWVAPAAWVRHALATPGVRFEGGQDVKALRRDGGDWLVLGAQGRPLARSPLLVLAQGAGALPLLAALGHAPWPLRHTRGQVTWFETGAPTPLRLPLAGDGYTLPLNSGTLLCGATRDPAALAPGDVSTTLAGPVRADDHAYNLQRLRRLAGLQPPAGAVLHGRVGLRLHSDDRLPIAGALPLPCFEPGQRLDQARLLPRERGLFVLTALGARGLTLAPLLAQLVAAQATGAPWPLEQDLADAVDPARWMVRTARAAHATHPAPQPGQSSA